MAEERVEGEGILGRGEGRSRPSAETREWGNSTSQPPCGGYGALSEGLWRAMDGVMIE